MIEQYNKMTLRQLVNRIEELSKDFNVYIQGKGNGEVRLIVEEKFLTIVPNAQKIIEESGDDEGNL
jgi:hypothetical protein